MSCWKTAHFQRTINCPERAGLLCTSLNFAYALFAKINSNVPMYANEFIFAKSELISWNLMRCTIYPFSVNKYLFIFVFKRRSRAKFPHSHATVQSDRLPKIERICAYERWVNGGIIQILSHRIYPIPTAFFGMWKSQVFYTPKKFHNWFKWSLVC